MGGKIDLYYDCNSPYSWYALSYLQKNREALESHGVHYAIHPVFLGGIMNKSGNKPPWTVPVKAAHGKFDKGRAQKYFGLEFGTPSFFPIMSLLPQRSMTYIEEKYPPEKLEAIAIESWIMLWKEEKDISKPEIMAECLSRHFGEQDVKAILQASNSPEYKNKLVANTDYILSHGAYGCPWFMVTNDKGVTEPFFGSDRFHYMWDYLGLPWKDIELLPKSKI